MAHGGSTSYFVCHNQSEHVRKLLKEQHGAGKDVAAICAAPIALHAASIAPGGKLTSHPSVKDQLEKGVWTVTRAA